MLPEVSSVEGSILTSRGDDLGPVMDRVHVTDRRLSDPTLWEGFTDPYAEYDDRDPFGAAVESAGGRVTYGSAETEAAVIDECADADVVVTFKTPLTERVIDSLEETRLIIRNGVGYDNVDVGAATARGIPVSNVPGNCNDEMASYALSLLLAAAHELVAHDRHVRSENGWAHRPPVNQLYGGTCGIVGFGRIGRALVPKVRGLEMDVLAYDPYADDDVFAYLDVERVTFEELLGRADAVSIHTPLTAQTKHMFSTAEFERMDEQAVIVNTGRGPIIDESALVRAVETGEIWGAGLDVFEHEPPTDSPVLDCDRIVCSPHRAGIDPEAERRAIEIAREEILRALRGETLRHVVNRDVLDRPDELLSPEGPMEDRE
jgi:D-3-phosphoglycerate dehydrogenase